MWPGSRVSFYRHKQLFGRSIVYCSVTEGTPDFAENRSAISVQKYSLTAVREPDKFNNAYLKDSHTHEPKYVVPFIISRLDLKVGINPDGDYIIADNVRLNVKEVEDIDSEHFRVLCTAVKGERRE